MLVKFPLLARFCRRAHLLVLRTLNMSLAESPKSFVDEQIFGRGFCRSVQHRRRPADKAYFAGLMNFHELR
jgi:hypothetical protein